MSHPASPRAKHAGTLTKQPPTPRATSARAQHASTLSGRTTPVAGSSARASAAQVGRNPALAGARMQEIIRMFVSVNSFTNFVVVTYHKYTILTTANAEQRLEFVTSTVIEPEPKGNVNLSPVELTFWERKAGQLQCKSYKSMTREAAGLDLQVLTAYVKSIVDFRDSAEHATSSDSRPLPLIQADQIDKDLGKATAWGMVPITATGAMTRSAIKFFPKTMIGTRQSLKWTAAQLSKLAEKLGKTPVKGGIVKSSSVLGGIEKIGGTVGVPKSVEEAQTKWLKHYLDPSAQPVCVYRDMKINGYDLYRKDVSPAWVKTGLDYLYKTVFYLIDKNPLF